jgi:hypothetical protein
LKWGYLATFYRNKNNSGIVEKAASMFFFTTSLFLRNHFSRDAVEKQRHGKSTVAKKAMSWKSAIVEKSNAVQKDQCFVKIFSILAQSEL